MKIEKTDIDGCYKITPVKFNDERGSFVKIFNESNYLSSNLGVTIREQYYSISKPGVLRGMHFQLPPMDHFKIVTCLSGEVLDVIVDLRKNSKTYKKCASFILNDKTCDCIYIPKGFAHGFYVLGNTDAIMLYNTETIYDSTSDYGIRYDSINFQWPFKEKPIISQKDSSLIGLDYFNNPF